MCGKAESEEEQPAMLRPPTEESEATRAPPPPTPLPAAAAVAPALYLREITAGMRYKIVFSFSAEFLKSSGHHDVRKTAARCHMFG